ncbi:transglycosylase domain-containing protein [soil metagenome]
MVGMRAVTSLARVTSLLGAFLAISVLMGLLGAGLMLPVVGATGTAAREGVGLFEELPGDLENNPLAQQSRIQAADGSLISTPAQKNRILVGLEDIAPVMRDAQVAIEDERYYDHGGLDTRALSRALVSNATSDSTQGGSTLTQQYVKMLLQEDARQKGDSEALQALSARSGTEGYVRKLRELKYAVTLEQRLTKDEILEGYLNLAYYGDRTYGVEAAARHYFGVSAKDLDLAQAATLAGVVRAPGITDPVNYPEAAVERRNVVLDRMYTNEMITEAAWRQARTSQLELDLRDSQRSCINSAHPYFCDYVTEWLLQHESLGATREERETLLTTGGLTVETTLDPAMADLIAETTAEYVPPGNKYNLASAGAMVEPGTGRVLAIGQSSEYAITTSEDRFSATSVNWSVDERYGGSEGFQIGSVAKAFVLVEALERGVPIEAELTVRDPGQVDEDQVWLGNPELEGPEPEPEGRVAPAGIFFPEDFQEGCTIGTDYYAVRNAEDKNHDPTITLREAAGKSVNTAFTTLASTVGTCEVRDTMAAMGLNSGDGDAYGAGQKAVPATFVLGADDASPLAVASSYATIAAGGMYCPPVPVTSITDFEGAELPLTLPQCEQVIDPDLAAGTAELMSEVLSDRGSGFRAVLDDERPAAGKTGSSDGSTHTWFAGFTPQLATSVWIGYPNGRDYSGRLADIRIGDREIEGQLYGSKLAAPMWKVLMEAALEGEPIEQFDEPSDRLMNGETRPVPSVRGMDVQEAIRTLGDKGFAAEQVKVRSGQPEGTVTSSVPSQARSAQSGSTVQIMVSSDDPGAPTGTGRWNEPPEDSDEEPTWQSGSMFEAFESLGSDDEDEQDEDDD